MHGAAWFAGVNGSKRESTRDRARSLGASHQRGRGEASVINDNITLTVTASGNGRIKIEAQAPREVPVNRGEVAARIAAEEAEPVVACG